MTTYDRLISKADMVKRCVDAVASGESVKEVALREGLLACRIYPWLRESGVPLKRGRPLGHDADMINLIRTVMTLRDFSATCLRLS